MNILELIQADGFQYKKVATTRGGEYHGPCPFCGGNDRFRIQPAKDRFYCRGCGKSGDSVQYLRDFKGMSYFDALLALGREPDYSMIKSKPILTPKAETPPPPEAWQERASSFAMQSQAILWDSAGDKMRQWLHTEKGLNDETIRKAGLGYNPTDIYEPRATWGLPSALNDQGKEKKQWLPAGLVIPFLQDGKVQRLRIRRTNPGDGNRYIIVSGSSSAPMAWHKDQGAAVIVESELDGLLLSQEAGDLCAVVALGSAQAKPDTRTDTLLKSAKTILVSLDTDEAGAKAAWDFWPKQYGKKFKRWHCLKGKDPSDSWKNGLDLRTWIQAGLTDKEPFMKEAKFRQQEGGGDKKSDKSGLPNLVKPIDGIDTAKILSDKAGISKTTMQDAPESSLPCEPPPPDTLTGAGLHKLICGETVLDFADGVATRLFMAKGNFKREYQGRTVQINQMDYLTIPADEIKPMLQSGLIKADRDIAQQGPMSVRSV
jgi:DNA primase